jgi:hypothetical protein
MTARIWLTDWGVLISILSNTVARIDAVSSTLQSISEYGGPDRMRIER